MIGSTDPQDMALLHFTSGTTGTPKGACTCMRPSSRTTRRAGWRSTCTQTTLLVHRRPGLGHRHLLRHHRAARRIGVTSIIDEADFDAERWYRILQDQAGHGLVHGADGDAHADAGRRRARRASTISRALRFIASVGEPLTPRPSSGARRRSAFRSTTTGGRPRPAGSWSPTTPRWTFGPGRWAAAARHRGGIVRRRRRTDRVDDDRAEPGRPRASCALRPGWPSMFRGYLDEHERYRKCFAGGWYLTGDLARSATSDGYFWFVGRADDVIKSSGHLIGPFEVESALMEHPAVAEAGVIGKPDPWRARWSRPSSRSSPATSPARSCAATCSGFARKRLGAAVAPKEIDFVASLPKTRSGKIMRRLLKARELGLPEGDTSTLEGAVTMSIDQRPSRRPRARSCAPPAARDAAHPPIRGKVRRAV